MGNSPRYVGFIDPPYIVTLTDDSGAALDLTGCTSSSFTLTMLNQNTNLAQQGVGVWTVANQTTNKGQVSYQWTTNDMATAGPWWIYSTVKLPAEPSSREFDPELILILPGTVGAGIAPPGTVLSPLPSLNPIAPFARPIDGYAIYENISPDQGVSIYGPRLQQIANGGFSFVLNYDLLNTNTSGMIGYINYAASLGLRVIIAIHTEQFWKFNHINWYPQLYADAGNPTTLQAMITYIVNQTKNLPGTWGWYVADEPSAGADAGALLSWTTYIRNADTTNKPRLLVESWDDSTKDIWQGSSPWDLRYCELGGDDFYPLGDTRSVWASTATIAAGIQATCKARNIQSCMVLQSFDQTQYVSLLGQRCTTYPACAPFPNLTQLQLQHDDCLRNMTPRLILYYSYQDLLNSSSPTTNWNNLVTVVKGGLSDSLFDDVISAQNPLRYYQLRDTTGFFATDSGTAHSDGTYHNNGLGSSGSLLGETLGATSLTSDGGLSTLFDGSQGYVELNTTGLPTGANVWTLFAVVKMPTVQSGYKSILSMGKATLYYTTQYHAGGELIVSVQGVTDLEATSPAFTAGNVYHLGATYDGSILKLYINGSLASQQTIGAMSNSYGFARIGADGTGSYNNAYISKALLDNKVWNVSIFASLWTNR